MQCRSYSSLGSNLLKTDCSILQIAKGLMIMAWITSVFSGLALAFVLVIGIKVKFARLLLYCLI